MVVLKKKEKINIAVFQMSKKNRQRLNSLIKNKSGDTWTLREIVTIVLAAIIVIGLAAFLYEIQAAIFQKKDDGSIANFDRLYPEIKDLMTSTEPRDYKIINYYLSSDYVIVGFDTEWDNQKKVAYGSLRNYNIYKPSKCGTSACICLYNDEWSPSESSTADKGLINCRSEIFSGKNVVFMSEGGDQNVNENTLYNIGLPRDDNNGNFLIYYSDYFGVKQLYIEKYQKTDENKYYIYISTIDAKNYPGSEAIKRKKEIDNLKNKKSV